MSAAASAATTTPSGTHPGLVLGTLGYMSPEQVRGQAADHRSDIFAFGAVLYELLSGRRAFQGATSADTMTAILKEDPPDLPTAERHLPAALGRIVDRCLEKNPAARFQSAGDLAFALDALSAHSGATSAVVGDVATARKRDPVAWSLVAVLAAALVAALTWAAIAQFRRPPVDARGADAAPAPKAWRGRSGLPTAGLSGSSRATSSRESTSPVGHPSPSATWGTA